MVGEYSLERAYPRIFRIALFKYAKVAEVPSQGLFGIAWNLPFVRDPHEWEIPIVGNLMKDLCLAYVDNDGRDFGMWTPSANGIFSSKSFFSILTTNHPILSQPSISTIWNSVAPPRVKAFSWISIFEGQNTMEVLQRRSFLYISPSIYCLCRFDAEFGNHIFLHCGFT